MNAESIKVFVILLDWFIGMNAPKRMLERGDEELLIYILNGYNGVYLKKDC